jgi:tetratricopeptide (TPR) repeat protein
MALEAKDGVFDFAADDEVDWKALKDEGTAFLKKEQYTEASASYAKALDACPEVAGQAICLSNNALALLKAGRAEESLQAAEGAVRTDPTYAKGHFRAGKALESLGRPDEAKAALLTAKTLEAKAKAAAGGRAGGAAKPNKPAPKKAPASFSLYDDKEKIDTSKGAKEREADAMLRKMKSSIGASEQTCLDDGVYTKVS